MLCHRKWQPTPVFLPAKFHGQRSLAGYSSWDRKESDTTERLTHTDIAREQNLWVYEELEKLNVSSLQTPYKIQV